MCAWLSTARQPYIKAFLSFTVCGLLTYCILYRDAMKKQDDKTQLRCVFLGINNSYDQVVDTTGLTKEEGRFYISQLVSCGRLNFSGVARYHLSNIWLTPEEREILTDEHLKDITTVAVAHTSTMTTIQPPLSLGPKPKVKLGDTVSVRVDLRDPVGRSVRKGGHYVRVWMQQDRQKDGRMYRTMAADITDLGNGSYVASFPVVWGGRTEVRAALHRPREFRRLMLSLMTDMKMTNNIVGVFSHGRKEQVTLCNFIPVIPGFKKVCNLTRANSGLPWYCGKPSTLGLNCDHWTWAAHTFFPQWYPATQAENILMRQFTTTDSTPLPMLPHTVVFNAAEPKSRIVQNKECSPLSASDSWTEESAKGFWQKDTWIPLTSCLAKPFTPPAALACFRNTRLLFLGDSNARGILEHFLPFMGCLFLPDPQEAYHRQTTHVPAHCVNRAINTSLTWVPHAFPFFSGDTRWSDVRIKRAPGAVLMDELRKPAVKVGASGRYVVLIHLFIHFSPLHSSIYIQHVRHAARAVERFLRRKPTARVFIRGPHAVYGNEFGLSGDLHGERSLAILRHEFRHLRDRVVLLNDWYMTLANQNKDIHPHRSVVDTLVKIMMNHVCLRP